MSVYSAVSDVQYGASKASTVAVHSETEGG